MQFDDFEENKIFCYVRDQAPLTLFKVDTLASVYKTGVMHTNKIRYTDALGQ